MKNKKGLIIVLIVAFIFGFVIGNITGSTVLSNSQIFSGDAGVLP